MYNIQLPLNIQSNHISRFYNQLNHSFMIIHFYVVMVNLNQTVTLSQTRFERRRTDRNIFYIMPIFVEPENETELFIITFHDLNVTWLQMSSTILVL